VNPKDFRSISLLGGIYKTIDKILANRLKMSRDMAFKEAFWVLYGIACANNASVAAHLEHSSGSIQSNVSFC
jgi:hypothetical protein